MHDIYEEDTTTEEVEADDATEAGPSETTLQTANTFPLSSTAFPRAVTVGVACPVCATCRCPAFPAAPPTTSLPAQSYHNTSIETHETILSGGIAAVGAVIPPECIDLARIQITQSSDIHS